MATREVPKHTRLHQLKKVGGFDLGIYYHEKETYKWQQNIDKFEQLVEVMQNELNYMKAKEAELV